MKRVFEPLIVLEKLFGDSVFYKKITISNLPFVYSNNFEFYQVTSDFDFIFIVPKRDDLPLDLAKGAYLKCKSVTSLRVVLYLWNAIKSIKTVFIESRVNFIASDFDHCFFENDKINNLQLVNDKITEEKYTKTTQLLVAFYLLNEVKAYSTREIAGQYNFSTMSVSRANAFLYEIGALEKIGFGNQTKYIAISKKTLLEKVKPFLINPIRKRKLIILKETQIKELSGYLSGENALSRFTNLTDIEFVELAFGKDKYSKLIDLKSNQTGDVACYLEEFIYDPSIFGKENVISLFDTYIIALNRYNNSKDPRIVNAIKQLEKELLNAK